MPSFKASTEACLWPAPHTSKMRTASERGGKICIDLQNTALGVIIDPQTMLLSVRVFQKTA